MFAYDSSWQLRSSVQSVESPQGLELCLCQLSSRCPGSGGEQVDFQEASETESHQDDTHINIHIIFSREDGIVYIFYNAVESKKEVLPSSWSATAPCRPDSLWEFSTFK